MRGAETLRLAAEAASPASARLLRFATPPVRLGMPELCRAGLSESWLWKVCGHRHWLALAAAHGLERPDFRDARGARLYPAFTEVRLEGGCLAQVAEHALLSFDVELRRTGHTRFASRIAVQADGAAVAVLHMESVFVRRAIAGRNRSATRGPVARPCGLVPPAAPTPPFRFHAWDEALGFRRAERREIARLTLDPSPHEDFNGADFLYFAAFQAMADRAEWTWFRRAEPLLHTAARRIHYAGNLELGDRVVMTLCGQRATAHALATWLEFARESDGGTIALAFTDRRDASLDNSSAS